jgi:UDP-glucose 4-epimerase
VLEVIAMVRHVSGHAVPTVAAPRRPGDPPALVASPELARQSLQWEPSHSSLETIIQTAWRWHSGAQNRADLQTPASEVSS